MASMLRPLWLLVTVTLFSNHVLALRHPLSSPKIVGGALTTIDQYPFQAALLMSGDFSYYGQICGASILNERSVLTAAHCFWFFTAPNHFRLRIGSTFANSGGVVHNVAQNIIHPQYNATSLDSDVAVVQSATFFVYNQVVQPVPIAGPNYNLLDNTPVWAVGWGATQFQGPVSEQLRHVQVWTVNQAICRIRYDEIGDIVTDNMLCSGWLDVGGRDQCQGDSGGPLLHNGVVVGICSWGEECGLARYPGVNARVSRFTAWIQANA